MLQQIPHVCGSCLLGHVPELHANMNLRWNSEPPTTQVDADTLGPDCRLATAYVGVKVSDRAFNGKVKGEKQVGANQTAAQRLPGGNRLLVTKNRLVEYNRQGEEVFNYQRPQYDIYRARKLRTGDLVFVTSSGTLTRMESKTQRL